MFTLTKAEALAIQAKQVDHYAAIYGDDIREWVAARTHAERLEDGVTYPVVEINRAIPRGGAIEALLIAAGRKTR